MKLSPSAGASDVKNAVIMNGKQRERKSLLVKKGDQPQIFHTVNEIWLVLPKTEYRGATRIYPLKKKKGNIRFFN
jgi:hypothetical protein